MIHLSREIRFALVSSSELAAQTSDANGRNSWSSWPVTNRIVPQLSLFVVVTGIPDPVTGYLCNVTVIDQALRRFVFEELIPSIESLPLNMLPSAERIARQAFSFMERSGPFERASLDSIRLEPSPRLAFSIKAEATNMIHLTQQYEFSAAHRLNCDSLSPEENIATFGKCNNPAGHGHNYVVEVTVGREMNDDDPATGVVIDIPRLNRIVNSNVIDRLDHKHLNEDIESFASTNPSVEMICSTVFSWLKDEIESAGCQLVQVKVFETPKTWASFSG